MLCDRPWRPLKVLKHVIAPLNYTHYQPFTMQSPPCRQILSQSTIPRSARVAIFDIQYRPRSSLRRHRQLSQSSVYQSRYRARSTCRKRSSVSAQQRQTILSRAEQAQDVYTVSLRTAEARKSIRFTQAEDGRIVIEAVAIGSEAQEVGIRPGQQLLSISDPIRNDEVWKISIETKLSRVRDALQFRSPPTVNLQLTESSIEDEAGFVWRSEEACGAEEQSGSQQDLLSNISGGAGAADDDRADRQTLADRLEAQQSEWKAKAAAEEAKYKARVAQRRDYMERESGRNDGPFFALLFSFFVLPAAVILLVAWQTGYLASLDLNQHF